MKRKLLMGIINIMKVLSRLIDGNDSVRILSNLSEKIVPTLGSETKYGVLIFYCLGELSDWRARTLLSKEPETIQWIDSFQQGDVLWDVGANIGGYSLYAAKAGIRTLAFEPLPANFFLLNKNIELNDLGETISSFCLAFSNETCLGDFYIANPGLGAANNSFSEAVDYQGNPMKALFKQTVMGFTIDDFMEQFSLDFPTHIKIDVDGIEDKIVLGALKVFSDIRVKSVLIELDTEREGYCREIISNVEKTGLKLVSVEHASELDNSTAHYVYNHIFKRVD